MAKTQTCDIPGCGQTAISTAKFGTTTTTAIEADLCEPHVVEIKKILRAFFKQDAAEIEIVNDEVKVVQPDKS